MAEMKCEAVCPYEHQIEAAYEKLITGNGDLPIVERVRNLESEMLMALPILQELQAAALRQDGRAQERIENETRRDKRTKAFRWWVMSILTVIGILLSFYVGEKALEDSHRGLRILSPWIAG
jgi:hypothetical protein